MKNVEDEDISCIPLKMEKYLSFSIGNLRFVDSYRFLSSSLEKEHFRLTNINTPPDLTELMLRKGVYPYAYIDSPNRFQETQLPPKEHFF